MDQQMRQQFPWKELAYLLLVGIPAFAIALSWGLFVWTYRERQYDIVILNGYGIGGVFDRLAALVLATLFGGVGIFSVMRFQRRMAHRQTRSVTDTRGVDSIIRDGHEG
jgi:hypothetical protein